MSNSPQQNSQVIRLKNQTVELSSIVDDILELIESEVIQQLNIEDRYATALGVERILRKHLAEEQTK